MTELEEKMLAGVLSGAILFMSGIFFYTTPVAESLVKNVIKIIKTFDGRATARKNSCRRSLFEVKNNLSEKSFIGADELAEAYETIKEAAASFDIDTVEFVLQSLEEYKLPENELEKFNRLKDAANKLEWEKISDLLQPVEKV